MTKMEYELWIGIGNCAGALFDGHSILSVSIPVYFDSLVFFLRMESGQHYDYGVFGSKSIMRHLIADIRGENTKTNLWLFRSVSCFKMEMKGFRDWIKITVRDPVKHVL